MTNSTKQAFARAMSFVRLLRLQSGEMPLQQVDVLLSIASKPGISMTEMATAAGLAQSSVSRNVAALSNYHRAGTPGLGFVEAVIDPKEPRRRLLFLTPHGKVFVTRLLRYVDPEFSMGDDTDARASVLEPARRDVDINTRTKPAKVKLPGG
jgi:DNA-binding MarR family transcriptional regulator